MRKPRLEIEVNLKDGVYHYQIYQKGQSIADMGNYSTDAEACEAAELKKVELQEAMMKAEPKPPKEKPPRKVKEKAAASSAMFPEACAFLEKAVTVIGAISIKEAGEHIERLNKAMETIENVSKDLSEIK